MIKEPKINFQVCFTIPERKQLEEESQKAGFKNLAHYVRYMTIGEGKVISTIQSDIKKIMDKLEIVE
jgi:hypothetical protein